MSIHGCVDQYRARLLASGLSNDRVAELSKGRLSASWVSKFRCGHMTNPRIASLMALEDALASVEPVKAAA